jgi:hypothetical protein
MRETKEREVMNKQQSEIDALGDYNAFSRPRPVIFNYYTNLYYEYLLTFTNYNSIDL